MGSEEQEIDASGSSQQATGEQAQPEPELTTAAVEEGAAEGEVMPGATADDLRAEVRKLRDENAGARVRVKRTEQLEHDLHAAHVAATGRLADPTDLSFDAAHLDNADALTAAIDELLTRKPHLASRTPTGDVGQGARPVGEVVSLAGMLRAGAG